MRPWCSPLVLFSPSASLPARECLCWEIVLPRVEPRSLPRCAMHQSTCEHAADCGPYTEAEYSRLLPEREHFRRELIAALHELCQPRDQRRILDANQLISVAHAPCISCVFRSPAFARRAAFKPQMRSNSITVTRRILNESSRPADPNLDRSPATTHSAARNASRSIDEIEQQITKGEGAVDRATSQSSLRVTRSRIQAVTNSPPR